MPPESSPPGFLSTLVSRRQYYFGQLDPSPSSTLTVACAGREECTPEYVLTRTAFRYHAIEYIHSGQLLFSSGGTTRTLNPGSVFTYAPEDHFRLEALPGEPLIKYFVDVGGRPAASLIRKSGLSFAVPGTLLPARWVHDVFEQLIHCGSLPEQDGQALACDLSRLLMDRIRLDTCQSQENRPERYQTFQRCLMYIHDHFREIHDVHTVCNACHVDRAYLSRLFQQYGEDSPFRVLVQRKVEYAAGLLRYQQMSVKQAAAEVGYEDPYHFSRVFKRWKGVPPSQFREGR